MPSGRADILGAISSAVCLLHCLLMPLVVNAHGLVHTYGNTTAGAHLHAGLALVDYLFVLLAIGSVYFSTQYTKEKTITIGLWISAIVFSIGIILHPFWIFANWVSYSGSVVLIGLHLYKWFQQHPACCKL
jgi:hypothetical protein